MAYSWRASALSYGAGSSVPITIPATAQVGDWMMLVITGDGAATGPSGWDLAASDVSFNNFAGKDGLVAYKTVVSGDPGSTVTISTAATKSAIGVWVVQGPVGYNGLNSAEGFASGTTGSQGLSQTTKSGDLLLVFWDAFVTGSTATFTSTNGTVTIDARDTTSSGASSAIGHVTASTGTSTQLTGSYSPTTGTQGYLAWVYRVTDYTVSAKAGGAATVSPPPALVAAAGGAAVVSININLTGATATITGLAPATGAAVGTSAPPIPGHTAHVTVNAEIPDFSSDGGDITILADTADVSVDAQVGVVTVAGGALGDNFFYPFVVGGSGATLTIKTNSYTIETDEPAAVWTPPLVAGDPGTVLLKTAWIRYTPNANGTLTITGATGAADQYQIELFEGDALDNLVRVDFANNFQFDPDTGAEIPPQIKYVVGNNEPVYIRFWPTGSTTNLTVNLTLALAADSSQQGTLFLTSNTSTFSVSPGVIRADVVGGTPDGDLVFDLQGTSDSFANPPGVGLGYAVATYSADTSGNLYGASIALPTVSAGTYTLRVTDVDTGLTDSLTIQVETDPIVPPATISPDDPIGSVSHGTAVKYWVLKDPAPSGLGTYQFTINPTTMTSPHAPRNVTIEHTVAADGHDIIWEGARRANDWRFQGTVLAQSDYQAIVAFAELNRRFWIVDHRDRAWVCSIESIGWTKKNAPYNDWAWDYDVTALIYDGPTSI